MKYFLSVLSAVFFCAEHIHPGLRLPVREQAHRCGEDKVRSSRVLRGAHVAGCMGGGTPGKALCIPILEQAETFRRGRTRIATIVHVTVEEWVYNDGPAHFMRILTFENGKVVQYKKRQLRVLIAGNYVFSSATYKATVLSKSFCNPLVDSGILNRDGPPSLPALPQS